MRIWRLWKTRRQRIAVAKTDEGIAQLRGALDWLGVERPVPRRVREVLRLFYGGRHETSDFLRIVIIGVGLLWTGPAVRAAWRLSLSMVGSFSAPHRLTTQYVEPFDKLPIYAVGPMAFVVVAVTVPMGIAVVFLMLGGPLAAGFVAFRGTYPASLADELPSGRVYRYRLVERVGCAVAACANAYGAGLSHEAAWLRRRVARELASVEEAVRRAHRTRGVLPARSHRRRELKVHAGKVAARLRAAEAALDVDGDAALPKLAGLLLKVAERYAEGRVGALLDPEDLENVTAVRDREPLRIATVVVLTVAGAMAVSLLSLPSAAEGPAIAGFGVLAVIVTYGRNARQALEVLTPFGGGK